MELFFLFVLLVLMAVALGSGYPVAFALPGSAIATVLLAAIAGYLFAGHTDAFFAHGGPAQWLSAGVTNLRGVYWEPERDTLIAIPLFIFMGIMLQRSKIAEELLLTMAQLFGPIPGGLGISVIFVGALLAATTGIVGATVVAMGLISLPAMLQNRYSKQLATGTIAASGTLGQIIPPSIVLIILADQLASAADQAGTARKALHKAATGELTMPSTFDVGSTSAGEMFVGAFIPGLVLVVLYMVFILIRALINPETAPSVPREGAFDRALALKVLVTLVPPLALIFLVLGSIIGGIATVNQAGAVGAAGALIMASYKLMDGRRGAYRPALLAIAALVAIALVRSQFHVNIKAVNTGHDVLGVVLMSLALTALIAALLWSGWRIIRIDNTMYGVMIETAKTTSLVFIILLGAAMLTAAFRAFGGEDIVREFLTSLPGGFWVQFIIVMGVIFLLGFFLDFIEIAVVVVPIVAPILLADPGANITAVWLGVMIGLNLQTSFLTPPFGFALFYLRGVAPPSVRTTDIYRGVVAFIGLQLLALVIVGLSPPMVNYLPQRLSLLSETAPPPRNPRLQYCIERYVIGEIDRNGRAMSDSFASARTMDLSGLPDALERKASASIDDLNRILGQVAAIHAAEQAVADAAPAYRPVHAGVRAIERDIAKFDKEIQELQTRLGRIRGEEAEDVERREALTAEIAGLQAEKDALATRIPADWDSTHDRLAGLIKAEENARNLYRRTADSAYDGVAELVRSLAALDPLEGIAAEVRQLQQTFASAEPDALAATIKEIEDRLGQIAVAGGIRTALSEARRAVSAATADRQKAGEAVEKALEQLDGEIAWRRAAKPGIGQDAERLEATIRNTIGLRLQPRLPREQALKIASCTSVHRDLSLNF